MFTQMRLMLQTMRFRHFEQAGALLPVTPRYPARKMLEFATLGGARVMGLEDEIGSLKPGKKADLLLTRIDSVNTSPVADPIAALVFYANASDVDSVWIDGIARKRHGRLVDADWSSIEKRLRESREAIFRQFSRIPEAQIRGAWAPLWGVELDARVSESEAGR